MADDAKVLDYIETWQALLERACRQWFESRNLTLRVNGNDGDTLFFGVPIISIDYVKINGSTEELSTDLYIVYNSRDYPDARRNPKISLARTDQLESIYTAPVTYGRLKFRRGHQNQEVKGDFGFIEPDDTTPKLIKRALCKLVIEKLTSPIFVDPSAPSPIPSPPPIVGPLLQERTDDHMRKWGQAGGEIADRKPGLTGITSDQEILDIIRLYRAPLGLATPSDWSFN